MAHNIMLRQVRRISQVSLERLTQIPKQQLVWRANEDDPRKHNGSHLGLFYQLPKEDEITKIFGYPSPYAPEITYFYKTIKMMPLMVRQPTLSIIDILRNSANQQEPNKRFLIYGDPGHGKTHALTHLTHYLHLGQEHILIQPREIKRFTIAPLEHSVSTSRPGRIDTQLHSAAFLQQFRIQNSSLLERNRDLLTCSKDYRWSAREITKAGEPIDNIIQHGIDRVIHSSDCVAVLMKELAMAADSGKIKIATIIDEVGYLFHYHAGSKKHPDYKRVLVDEMTVPRALKKLIKGNHKGSITVASCDDILTTKQNQTPEDVLREDGLDHFQNSHRIHMPKYNRIEFENCMNLYQDIGWTTRPESRTQETRDEIRFVSGLNPREVHYLSMAL